MNHGDEQCRTQVALIERWADGQFSVTEDNSLYYRLSGGYELIVSNGQPVGDLHTGMWTVLAYQFGELIHTIPSLITFAPSDHLTAARSAVVTLKCMGLISADSVEA